MQNLRRAAVMAAFSFLVMLSVAVTNPARSQDQCFRELGVIDAWQEALPGIYVFDTLDHDRLAKVAAMTGLDPAVGRIVVMKHAQAVTRAGPILLLIFFDQNGCYLGEAEVPEVHYLATLAAAGA